MPNCGCWFLSCAKVLSETKFSCQGIVNCKFSAHFNDSLFWFRLLITCNYKGKCHRGPWEGKIQIGTKGVKVTGKIFHLVYIFSKISLSWTLPSSEWGSFSPVVKALLHPTALPAAPLRHSPEATQGDTAHPGGNPKIWLFWKIWQMEGGPSVWWLCTCVVGKNCQRHRGIPFVSKVLLQRNRHPHVSLRKALCGRLCGPSYNAMTEKPVFNWSFTENAQSR